MKPKGSQFSQMEMFPETKTESPPEYRGNFGKPKRGSFADRGPFNSDRSRIPFHNIPMSEAGDWVDQESLPNGMDVMKRPKEAGLNEKGVNTFSTANRGYEWVPTHQVSTYQEAVEVPKLNSLANKGYDRSEIPKEGQETEESVNVPYAYKFADDQYVVTDGNHRTTVERHQGAMFHRMFVGGEYSYDLPGRKNWVAPDMPDRPSKFSKGTYKP